MDDEVAAKHQYKHPGGRTCTKVNGEWRYGEEGEYKCESLHLKHELLNPYDDRGAFGMPGLGLSGIFPVADEADHISHHQEGEVTAVHTQFEDQAQVILKLMGLQATVDYGEQGLDMTLTPQAARVTAIIVGALIKFWEKNQGYGNTAYALGARGQYADMNRKMGKLKHTLWDGHEAVG